MNKQWQQLPIELQYTDAEIRNMNLIEMERAFTTATKEGVLDDFTRLFFEAIERVRAFPERQQMQEYVHSLEQIKRNLGRKYDYMRNIFLKAILANRYNETEYKIRWIVEQYDLDRDLKPYTIGEEK